MYEAIRILFDFLISLSKHLMYQGAGIVHQANQNLGPTADYTREGDWGDQKIGMSVNRV